MVARGLQQTTSSQPLEQGDECIRASTLQKQWAVRPIRERLALLRDIRHETAKRSADFVSAMPPSLARNGADTLAAEVLPLLAACRFLEKEAAQVLQARELGRRGLPFWLNGVRSTVQRVPWGLILVIGPANYPLFLPGVQVLQALTAGNAVIWKPAPGGQPVAMMLKDALDRAGVPQGLVRVTGESVDDGIMAMRAGVDKVFFTGSSNAGRAVLRAAAETTTPVVAELSGCDAVVVLPSANMEQTLAALEFGMRFNGSATCMAPRRLMLVGRGHDPLILALSQRFAAMDGVLIREPVRRQLQELVDEAVLQGATVSGDVRAIRTRPLLLLNVSPRMRVAQADIFAPILGVMRFADAEEMLRADALCPFGLTAAVFGDEEEARALGERMKVGTILINDLIVPTADPRVPFGGRRGSGFGATRGVEGLLEMTAPRVVQARAGSDTRHLRSTHGVHETLFAGVIQLSHERGFAAKMRGLSQIINAVKTLRSKLENR